MQIKREFSYLKNVSFHEFVVYHLKNNTNIQDLAFKKDKFSPEWYSQAIQNIALLKKQKNKLPTFYNNGLELDQELAEQASSELAANAKSKLIEGDTLIDCTGGLGVDALYFSKVFKSVYYLELNQEKVQIVQNNFKKLAIDNVFIRCQDSLKFILPSISKNLVLYADPSRRVDHLRENAPEKCVPKVSSLIEKSKNISAKLLVKFSPLFHYQEFLRLYDNMSMVCTISIKGELKEILYLFDFTKSLSSIHFKSINIQDGRNISEFSGQPKNPITILNTEREFEYLYKISPGITQLDLQSDYCQEKGLILASNYHYCFGTEQLLVPELISYKIIDSCPLKKKDFSLLIKKYKITKVQILKSEKMSILKNLVNKHKLKNGENYYLLGLLAQEGSKVFLLKALHS